MLKLRKMDKSMEVLAELKKRCKSRNENVSFTVPQLGWKFKKLVAECKRVALTTKTSTRVKRFYDDKGYTVPGSISCFKESKHVTLADQNWLWEDVPQSTENEGSSGASQDCAGKQFVPVKSAATKKMKRKDPLVEAFT